MHCIGSELLKLCLAKAAVPVMQVETSIYEQVWGLPKFKALPINKGRVLEKHEHYLFPDVHIKTQVYFSKKRIGEFASLCTIDNPKVVL